jgi:hypothetical protein
MTTSVRKKALNRLVSRSASANPRPRTMLGMIVPAA